MVFVKSVQVYDVTTAFFQFVIALVVYRHLPVIIAVLVTPLHYVCELHHRRIILVWVYDTERTVMFGQRVIFSFAIFQVAYRTNWDKVEVGHSKPRIDALWQEVIYLWFHHLVSRVCSWFYGVDE